MTELEYRAFMGNKKAQEKCSEKGIVLPCPFCGGNGKVSFKDSRFIGQNLRGDKKLVYRIQVICNKCRSRGKPVFTKPIINPNPYITKWGNNYHAESNVCRSETERFYPYVLDAVTKWNTRIAQMVVYGHWGPGYHDWDGRFVRDCSICAWPNEELSDYCPNCGADMRGIENEN